VAYLQEASIVFKLLNGYTCLDTLIAKLTHTVKCTLTLTIYNKNHVGKTMT